MQTLRKKSSPCKYKHDPSRFLGEGITFKAKLIGILEVNEARGDKMCQDALNDLKTAIRAAGEHKQRITISIAIDGLRLRDEKTGDCMYHHPVHKISFIAQDMSDSRAFGYIFGSPDTGHRFFGIKTDKTASQVVIAMRDLFQVVFELKKKEIELAKHQHQLKFGSSNNSYTSTYKEESGSTKHKSDSRNTVDMGSEPLKSTGNVDAIADLLDLEDELNSIQQGISQMERITPSDPFGPIAKDPFADPFSVEDVQRPSTSSSLAHAGRKTSFKQRTSSQSSIKEPDSGIFSAGASTKAQFFSQYSPTPIAKTEEPKHWFDKETEGIFHETSNTEYPEIVSPEEKTQLNEDIKTDNVQISEDNKTIVKADIFTDLDPLGTGKIKPYLDKKDFFQELKNPPKKVLKELITEPTNGDGAHYFHTDFDDGRNDESTSAPSDIITVPEQVMKEPTHVKVDPFEDADPFDTADPFLESNFPKSIGFPPLSLAKTSNDILQERTSSRYDRIKCSRSEEIQCSPSPSKSLFSTSFQGALRVSLPPEKTEISHPISLSSITSRFRSSPSPTEESRTFRRRHYQSLKQNLECERIEKYGDLSVIKKSPRLGQEKSFPQSIVPPTPPPKNTSSLFAIKPPPLPPKKNQRSYAKTPSPVTVSSHMEKSVSLSPQELSEMRQGSPKKRRHNSDLGPKADFPLLPPPPTRKPQTTTCSSKPPSPCQSIENKEENNSVFNITLNKLDQSGLQNIAETLGIPTENVCNMTLQELTKRLAHKYLGSHDDTQQESKSDSGTFEADFESMFEKSNNVENTPYFDKYAPFKELIAEGPISNDVVHDDQEEGGEEEMTQEDLSQKSLKALHNEDKYAALRHLSLSTQKSENLSEEFDVSNEEDSSARADNISDIMKQHTDESFTPLHSEQISESPIVKFADWNQMTLPEEEEDLKENNNNKSLNEEEEEEELPKENWAKFDEKQLVVSDIKNNVNDNSPSTSEGKEDSTKFTWHKSESRSMDTPWHDDEDDYSPKDLQWSDESSLDDNSPINKNGHRRLRKCRKHSKDYPCKWTERSEAIPSKKWIEDTEDEYEEMRRRRRQRPSSFDRERRREFHVPPYDRYERHWDGYMPQPYRRSSRDQDDYYKRCESDGSEKEYKYCSYEYGSGKNRHPHTAREITHWTDPNQKVRAKIKKSLIHKRPNSASDSKKIYERNYTERNIDKPFKRESEDDDLSPEFRYTRKELRPQFDDRRCYTLHQKRVSRFSRGPASENVEIPDKISVEIKEKRHFFPTDTPKEVAFNKESRHVSTDKSMDGFEDDFTPSPVDRSNFSSRNIDSPIESKSKFTNIRKSESINIFSRENDPFEDDEFFSSASNINSSLSRFAEKSKSNTNVSDPFTWTEVFGD